MTRTHAIPESDILEALDLTGVQKGASYGPWIETPSGPELVSASPNDGSEIGRVLQAGEGDYEKVMEEAGKAFLSWRMRPAPERGEVVRLLAGEFRKYKEPLGALISLEMGKVRSEGEGEVQEMIDIADFAVGLSRQLYGLTMHSERPGHRMYEQWHPLGVVGVVTAFNFPGAVWAWNAMIAAVCGDVTLWKPSSKTPLTAIAIQKICNRVTDGMGLDGVFSLVVGRGSSVGERLINDRRIPLVSATGSCRMGRRIGEAVAKRLARSLLELGGNNAIIVSERADLEMALRGILFGAVGTAGQRCTSTRRVFLHRSIAEEFTARLTAAYASVRVGHALAEDTLMGPLVDEDAVRTFEEAIKTIRAEGGEILHGGNRVDGPGFFVEPTLVKAKPGMPITREETFAPILYLFDYDDLDQAIAAQNGVDQGLSSAIFTTDLLEAEEFLSHRGSDCGIANVNIGTSGAEIGGAFGGEKDTGGGREAGSDSWKIYMRRQTCTLNWSREMALAQGVKFDI
ncbi:MAG: aldehyde dehydrogenase family protein [Gemmatimonadota bacterium]|jgi:aldehyde dehydrogenase (NAD+)|nr:aldehyde dehydrogenase family protein [Gemmatimonadota bacterium]MDP6529016.1 aldehyde dehydrogenase family protein [Gemmatimonadota bacterium]MDP6802243.1 aldehyde dehydrogenase family protein [Gemmatimonadota bacterium]MDP7032164.1 aldehyde dehydrogenase family protein [Gemmatimonadota bacterium]